MKKLLLSLVLIIAILTAACTSTPTNIADFKEDEIEKIVITLAMGNPDYGASSKTIMDADEIGEFVQLFNSAQLGEPVSEDDLAIGSVSTYAFYDDEKLLKTFAFNVNDTGVLFWASEPHTVIYPEGAKAPFELYEDSAATELTGETAGGELTPPADESEVSSTAFADVYIDVLALATFENIISFEPYTFCDRTITLEVPIDNDLKSTVFNLYFYLMSGEFDKISLGEDIGFNNAIENSATSIQKDEYVDSYTIHSIDVLSYDDIANISIIDSLNTATQTFNLIETALVFVDKSMTYSDKMLEMGPQIPEGRYERYYLLGKTQQDENFKIYNVYWGEQLNFS